MNVLRNLFIASVLLSLPLVGCKPPAPPVDDTAEDVAAEIADVETEEAQDEHAHEYADDHDHHAEIAEAKGIEHLVLNDGEKWPMDEHTRKLAGEMNETVDSADVESAEDGQEVGETLNAQLATLVKGCTMTGPAHDNLHVFLGAFMPVVNALEAAESDEVAQEKFNEVKSLLATYGEHFE